MTRPPAGALLLAALLALGAAATAEAGGRGGKGERPLSLLRGELLAAGAPDPFAEPGEAVGRFLLRAGGRRDLRDEPGLARLRTRRGSLRARAAAPWEDLHGLIELCRNGLLPLPCPPEEFWWPRTGPRTPLAGSASERPANAFGDTPITTRPRVERPEPAGVWWPERPTTVIVRPDSSRDSSLRAGGNDRFGRRDFTEEGFRDELAAQSFELLMGLVTLARGDPDLDPGGQCSFVNPTACAGVQDALAPWRITELEDDPRGGARERWLWESAVAYEVVDARGDLGEFAGGRLYVYGPAESPLEGRASGVALLLVPPAGVLPATPSPLVREAPGPDHVPGSADDTRVGLAWGAARTRR